MTIYDCIKLILEELPATRNSDNLLIWEYAIRKGFVLMDNTIASQDFMKIPFESCRRSRQSIMVSHPELRGTNYKERQLKAKDYPEIFVEQDGQVRGI